MAGVFPLQLGRDGADQGAAGFPVSVVISCKIAVCAFAGDRAQWAAIMYQKPVHSVHRRTIPEVYGAVDTHKPRSFSYDVGSSHSLGHRLPLPQASGSGCPYARFHVGFAQIHDAVIGVIQVGGAVHSIHPRDRILLCACMGFVNGSVHRQHTLTVWRLVFHGQNALRWHDTVKGSAVVYNRIFRDSLSCF